MIVVVSIDVEEDNWVPARTGITVDNVRELERLDRVLERLGIRATYFTTYQVGVRSWASGLLRELAATGRVEIAAHLHPWNTPPVELPLVQRNTMSMNLPQPLQATKIRRLTDVLEAGVGRRPSSFRTGRWGFGGSTAAALLECGYTVDSSVTPNRSWLRDGGPTYVGAPSNVYRLDGGGDPRIPVPGGSLIEVPVSWGYLRGPWSVWKRVQRFVESPLLRPLRLMRLGARLHLINHVGLSPEIESVPNMLRLSRRLMEGGVQHLHVSWHSPSLRSGLGPFAATAGDVERLYARIEEYFGQLGQLTDVRFATVAEAAEALAPALPARSAPPRGAAAVHVPRRRRLLVISYHYPPDPAIGSMRWAGLTKYLANLGWDSRIITAAQGDGVLPPGIQVDRCPRNRTVGDWYGRVRQWQLQNLPLGRDSGRGGLLRGERAAWFRRARLEAAMLLSLPDEGRGWMLRAARHARRLVRTYRPDVVVSSGPPHSAHVVALLAVRAGNVRWIADLRDPWAGPLTGAWQEAPTSRSRVARWMFGRLERAVVGAADALTCTTATFAEALRSRYQTARVECIPNGVDAALLPRASEAPFQGLALAYVGTLYGSRSLEFVMKALRVFLDAHPDGAARETRLRVAGDCDEPHLRDLRAQIRSFALESHVEVLGMLPRAQALELVSRSRLVFVLAQQQEYQVPAKLYELVAMHVPTVVVSEVGGAAGSEAARLGAFRVDPDDVPGLVGVMERVWLNDHPARAAEPPQCDYRDIAYDVRRLLSSLL